MPQTETKPMPAPATSVMSNCPECRGRLVILSVIAGKAASEYWTLRCAKCGGIHLDIVKPEAVAGQ
jgi:hypothetical protein